MISDPNPVLVENILCLSENYPKVYYDAQHILYFYACLFCLMRQNNFGVILLSAEHDWLK